MNKIKYLIIMAFALLSIIGCNPNIPPIQTIEPSQTAFLVPLEGQTSNQGSFNSEKFLEDSKVATKRVTIPQRWRGTGSLWFNGEWIPVVKLIIVERKPESRHWDQKNKNPLTAESKESIAFEVGIACTAQIDEADAAKFLYRYNNKSLSEVMNDEILNRIRTKFVEQSAIYNLNDLLVNKGKIMDNVRNDIEPYFKARGINITSLGLIGDLNYVNEEIQTAINSKFIAQQALVAQKDINEKNISKAKSDALVAQTLNNPNALLLKNLELQSKFLDKWNGVSPQAIGNGTLFSLPFSEKGVSLKK